MFMCLLTVLNTLPNQQQQINPGVQCATTELLRPLHEKVLVFRLCGPENTTTLFAHKTETLVLFLLQSHVSQRTSGKYGAIGKIFLFLESEQTKDSSLSNLINYCSK